MASSVDRPHGGAPDAPPTNLVCAECGAKKESSNFSSTQLRKSADSSRCADCVGSGLVNGGVGGGRQGRAGGRGSGRGRGIGGIGRGRGRGGGRVGGRSFRGESASDAAESSAAIDAPPTPLVIAPRPVRPVPGFEHAPDVAACVDWLRSKKGGGGGRNGNGGLGGNLPGAQSAVFMPLLACAMGVPIEGHCTSEQLDVASRWWAEALPAWPRWIEELRASGLASPERKEGLIRGTTAGGRARPVPLVPGTRGRGTVPHFRGKLQTKILEEARGGMLSIELYACVACLYSGASPLAEEREESSRSNCDEDKESLGSVAVEVMGEGVAQQ